MKVFSCNKMGGATPSGRMKRIAQAGLGAVAVMGLAGSGHAFEVTADADSNMALRWDNTLKYSAGERLMAPNPQVLNGTSPGGPFPPSGALGDDGDLNFKKNGLMTDRVDWFTQLDGSYKNFGFRFSGAAWYDAVYKKSNANTSQAPSDTPSVPVGQFSAATAKLMGDYAEVLDAFVSYKSDSDSETPYVVRLGKHSVVYGETLFMGANGIAYAQSPVDLIKLLMVPGSQFKEIIRPVDQLSTQIQLSSNVSFGAYYQFGWEPTRLPPSGSYLSDADYVGAGAETLLGARHINDINGKNTGQEGLQLRFTPEGGTVEYGLYAAQYNDKLPQIMLSPGLFGGSNGYRLVYADGVKTFGASFSTAIGETNVSGEASIRTNAPLVSAPQLDMPLAGNGSNDPLYAVGRTAHVNLSSITLFGRSPIWDGASFLNELGWNRTLSIQDNPLALDPNRTRDATALRMILEPQYFQVASGVDLAVPIGLGYNPSGRSSAVSVFNGGVEHGGDLEIGMNATVKNLYKVGVQYVHYFGPANAFAAANTNPNYPSPYMLTEAQALHDRDFITVSFQATF